MDHNMVLSYNYAKQKRRQQRTNAPPSQAISIAMRRHWRNSCGIARWRMSRAILEATGRCHRATTCSILLPRTPGWQSTTQWWINTPTLRAVLMAIAMRRYDTVHIAQWRRSRASPKATGFHYWASTPFDSHQSDMPTPVFRCFSSSNRRKRPQSTRIAPNSNRGMTYQTDETYLTSLTEYFVGEVSIAFNCLNNHFLVRVINQ